MADNTGNDSTKRGNIFSPNDILDDRLFNKHGEGGGCSETTNLVENISNSATPDSASSTVPFTNTSTPSTPKHNTVSNENNLVLNPSRIETDTLHAQCQSSNDNLSTSPYNSSSSLNVMNKRQTNNDLDGLMNINSLNNDNNLSFNQAQPISSTGNNNNLPLVNIPMVNSTETIDNNLTYSSGEGESLSNVIANNSGNFNQNNYNFVNNTQIPQTNRTGDTLAFDNNYFVNDNSTPITDNLNPISSCSTPVINNLDTKTNVKPKCKGKIFTTTPVLSHDQPIGLRTPSTSSINTQPSLSTPNITLGQSLTCINMNQTPPTNTSSSSLSNPNITTTFSNILKNIKSKSPSPSNSIASSLSPIHRKHVLQRTGSLQHTCPDSDKNQDLDDETIKLRRISDGTLPSKLAAGEIYYDASTIFLL